MKTIKRWTINIGENVMASFNTYEEAWACISNNAYLDRTEDRYEEEHSEDDADYVYVDVEGIHLRFDGAPIPLH